MSDKCPFCGASIIEQVVCPKCRRANYDVGITKYICGSIRDSANEWFRSIECVEAELARKDELLRVAGEIINTEAPPTNHCAKARKRAFLSHPEVVKTMEEKRK